MQCSVGISGFWVGFWASICLRRADFGGPFGKGLFFLVLSCSGAGEREEEREVVEGGSVTIKTDGGGAFIRIGGGGGVAQGQEGVCGEEGRGVLFFWGGG